MVKLEWGKVGVSSLIVGIIAIFGCFVVLAIFYGALMIPATGEVLIEREAIRSVLMAFLFVALILIVGGILGGFELGRYVQMQLIKRKPHLLEPRK